VLFTVRDLPARAVMGIVNVTPDSFSDGGQYLDACAAVDHALVLIAGGAVVIDVGGESTRPGAEPVSASEELTRVMPVIEGVRAQSRVLISVDTTKPSVARAALLAGADIVNDVSGGRGAELLAVVAERDAGLVLMHMQGEPRSMQNEPQYDDVVAEVGDYLGAQVAAAVAAGVRRDAIVADPGIGFGKTAAHNLALLGRLAELERRAGVPLMVGASRKRTLAEIVGDDDAARDDATLAVTVMAFAQGAGIVRVHDVRSSVLAARWIEGIEVAA
jgi:dihydropteroate synthase